MQRRASYRSAALRSNSFVDFIQQQKQHQKQQEREEVLRQVRGLKLSRSFAEPTPPCHFQGSGAAWLDDLHKDPAEADDDGDGDEEDTAADASLLGPLA